MILNVNAIYEFNLWKTKINRTFFASHVTTLPMFLSRLLNLFLLLLSLSSFSLLLLFALKPPPQLRREASFVVLAHSQIPQHLSGE